MNVFCWNNRGSDSWYIRLLMRKTLGDMGHFSPIVVVAEGGGITSRRSYIVLRISPGRERNLNVSEVLGEEVIRR